MLIQNACKKKEQSCQNNPQNSYTERKVKHKLLGYSLDLICSFDKTKNKRNFYRGKDCIEKFCKNVKEFAIEMSNYREHNTLKNKEIKFYESQEVCHICKGWFCYDNNKDSEFKLYHKVRDHCHYTRKFTGAAHNIFSLRYKVSKKMPVVFRIGSTYDYHFIIKQLA